MAAVAVLPPQRGHGTRRTDMKQPDAERGEARDTSVKRPEEAIEDLEPDEGQSDDVKGGFNPFTITRKIDIPSPSFGNW
jgi:hypothetical protein